MWLLALVVTTIVMIVSGIWSLISWWLILFFFRHFTLTVIAMPPFSIVGLVPRFLAVPFSP